VAATVPRIVSSADPSEVIDVLQNLVDGDPRPVFVHDPNRPAVLNGTVPDEAALIVETSGSTGTPKQVWLTKDALLWSARTTSMAMGPSGAWWLAVPAHFIAGIQVIVRSLLSSRQPIVANQSLGVVSQLRSVGDQLLSVKEGGTPVYTSLVPTQLQDLLQAVDAGEIGEAEFQVFSNILVGGQKTPQYLIERGRELGVPMIRTYGSAETAGGCVWDGRALDGVSMDIVDGEVALSGPMLAGGYLGDSAGDQRFIERNGARWFRTRDFGVVEEGVLSVTGRSDDVIISGGKKVSLSAIEEHLEQSGLAVSPVVVSAAHPRWGQVPIVVTTQPTELERLRDSVGAKLGEAAKPFAIEVVDHIPLLSSRKPDRRILSALVKARLSEGDTHD
jgi:O-succinylbenzoic acid--CoA ligase